MKPIPNLRLLSALTFVAMLSDPANLRAQIVTNCDPVPAGVVAWWKAEGNALDSAGTNNGTLQSGVAFALGEVGLAFSLSGAGASVNIPRAPQLDVGNQVTVEFWMKADPANPMTNYQGLVTSDFYGIEIADGDSLAQTMGLNFFISTSSGAFFPQTADANGGGAPVSSGQWHHVAGTYDGTQLQLYVDGQPRGNPYPYSGIISPMLSTSFVTIGSEDGRMNCPSCINARYFNGLIDEATLYNRALSAAEIAAIYEAGSSGKCPLTNPPVIISQPTNLTVSAGTSATFTVLASGAPLLAYQWYYDSNVLAGATAATLTLSNLAPSQSGYYSVVITNQFGSVASSNALLSVIPYPPSISIQPRSTNLFAGSPLFLSVFATGTIPLAYQWYKDSNPIPGALSSAYTVASAQTGNSGTYFVTITNLYGAVTSSNAVVSVLPPPPCTPVPPGLVSWWRAETNQLDNWDSNDGIVSVASYGPGKVGQAFVNPSVIILDSFSLHITNALTLQAWVNPTTVSGASPYTIVSKYDSPTLPGTGSQSSFWLGTTNHGYLYFQVSGTGSQRTNVAVMGPVLPLNQWSFVVATYDGTALRLYVNGTLAAQRGYSGGIFPGNQNLGIGGVPNAINSTATEYPFSGSIDEICIYSRALTDSEIQGIYAADVSGMCLQPPVIVAQPHSQAVPLGEDVLFSAGVQGDRPLRYQWFFNSNRLLGATNSSLVLERLRTNQAGAYSVSVTNSLGFATSAVANLTLLPAPACFHAPDGMISWWPANDSPLDVIGTNNASLLLGGTYVTGKVGQAFAISPIYPPIQAGRIQVANSPSLNFGSNADFSIEAWVKAFPNPVPRFQAPFPSQGMIIVQKRGSSPFFPQGPGYALTLYEGRLAFWLSSSAVVTNPAVVASGPDLRDSMFHHMAVTLQRSVTNGGRLYVDGQLVQTFDAHSASQRGSLSNSFPLYIASTVEQTPDSLLNGYIDELAIYNRALSADEILAIRTAGAAGKCDHPPLVSSFLTKGLQDEPLLIPAYRFLLFSYDPDGDPLSLFSVTSPSQNGRPVVLGTNQVTYTPPAGYLGQDSFTYTISDGHGARISASALVLIEPRMAAAANLIAPVPPGPGGLQLTFVGYPARTYTIQRAESLAGPWTDLGTAATDADGLANFTDPSPPSVSAYYRAVYISPPTPALPINDVPDY